MRKHEKTIHDGIVSSETFPCPICTKTFTSKSKLESHVRLVHMQKKNHQCNHCKQSFITRAVFEKHVERAHQYHEKTFKCDLCNKSFSSKRELKSHFDRSHTKWYSVSCDKCPLVLSDKRSYMQHNRVVHENIAIKKPFQCNICLKCERSREAFVKNPFWR